MAKISHNSVKLKKEGVGEPHLGKSVGEVSMCASLSSSQEKSHSNNDNNVNSIEKTNCPNGCSSFFIMPSLIDMHVHFREPGNPEKETILTGSQAALSGGFSVVCTMPNLTPAPDSLENLKVQLDSINSKLSTLNSQLFILPYGCITKGRKGKEPANYEEMMPYVGGFSDDGCGVEDDAVMEECMKRVAKLDGLIVAHCEKNNSEACEVERNIRLAKKTGCRLHLCHISTKESIEYIRKGKAKGVKVTCETAPHYLMFENSMRTDEWDGRFKMNPPIGSAEDRQALIEALQDGTIDVIATDHAPHTAEEKRRGFEKSLCGIVGLESSFPIMYTYFVRTGIITMDRLIDLMSNNARRILRIKDELPQIKVDLETPFVIDAAQFKSKGHSCPFDGMKVYGRILDRV